MNKISMTELFHKDKTILAQLHMTLVNLLYFSKQFLDLSSGCY